LAEVLNPDGRLGAADKLILASLAGTGALAAVYWNRLPAAPDWPLGRLGLPAPSCRARRAAARAGSGAIGISTRFALCLLQFTFDTGTRLSWRRVRCRPRS
jgi:hypothetical protein